MKQIHISWWFFFLRAWEYKGAEQQNRCKTNTAEIIETATLLTKHLLAYNIWKHFLTVHLLP